MRLTNAASQCYRTPYEQSLHEWEQRTREHYAKGLVASTKIYQEHLDKHYQQMREWQGQVMPRGTNSRRLGVLDSPISPINDGSVGSGNEPRDPGRIIQDHARSSMIHEFYRDTHYIFKHEDSLT